MTQTAKPALNALETAADINVLENASEASDITAEPESVRTSTSATKQLITAVKIQFVTT
jgi:hypothetical protein